MTDEQGVENDREIQGHAGRQGKEYVQSQRQAGGAAGGAGHFAKNGGPSPVAVGSHVGFLSKERIWLDLCLERGLVADGGGLERWDAEVRRTRLRSWQRELDFSGVASTWCPSDCGMGGANGREGAHKALR